MNINNLQRKVTRTVQRIEIWPFKLENNTEEYNYNDAKLFQRTEWSLNTEIIDKE